MRCRRCGSRRLLRLEKKLAQDNEVFRCLECGFLFSPSVPPQGDHSGGPKPSQSTLAATILSGSLPRAVADANAPLPRVGPGE